jgi:hypothetical protein
VLRSDMKEASNLGERKTFLQALLSGKAGCTGRGRGQGRGSILRKISGGMIRVVEP